MDKLMSAARFVVKDARDCSLYLIFAHDDYYPCGGCRDFKAYANSIDELNQILNILDNDSIHVLNVNTMTIIATKQKGKEIEFCNIRLDEYDEKVK